MNPEDFIAESAAEALLQDACKALRADVAALRKDAERWRYWRNYWPALCRMEVARFACLDLRTTYVQSPADMDKVTDAAMAAAPAVG